MWLWRLYDEDLIGHRIHSYSTAEGYTYFSAPKSIMFLDRYKIVYDVYTAVQFGIVL